MRIRGGVAVCVLMALVSSVGFGAAGKAAKTASPATTTAPARTAVLDTAGFWRMHNQFKPPVILRDDGAKPVRFNAARLDEPTQPAPQSWMQPDFDDSGWARAVVLRQARTPLLARLCLRGRFQVTDPAAVKDLSVKVVYHGGAVVYLNGKEVARQNLPAGAMGEDTLAEGYSAEAFVSTAGGLLSRRNARGPEDAKRLALQDRTLTADIPAGLLRKGVNVLAVEVIRAPYNKIQDEVKETSRDGKPTLAMMWYTCAVQRVQLTAAADAGLVPAAVRPPGLQVWNSDLMMSDFDMDFGDPAEPLRPIRIVAARNGSFSGKVVVGSTIPLRGLKAVASDLKSASGETRRGESGEAVISASAVRVRFALPWGREDLTVPYSGQAPPYQRPADVLGALAEAPLEEFPVRIKPKPLYAERYAPGSPEPVFGAVTAVWVTVDVPAAARSGAYVGSLRIEVDGDNPVAVPVELRVVDWALPATKDYRTWAELIESPDTLALEYGEKLWSPKHWQLIDQAFRYIGQTGSRVVHVPLMAQTNLGNEESMVRWVRKPGDGNQYDYDFTVLDRYLDSVQTNMGAPKLVCFWVWDAYLMRKNIDLEDKRETIKLLIELGYIQGEARGLKAANYDPNLISAEGLQRAINQAGKALTARKEFLNKGPMVTMVGPGGTVETAHLPPYDDPASKAIWAPLLARIRGRMKARGLEKAMTFGMVSDARPSKEEVAFFHDLAPDVPWASQAHFGVNPGQLLQGIAPVAYLAKVWSVQFSVDKSLHGWYGPSLIAYYDRDREITPHASTLWAHLAEMSITGNQRGTGRLGADFWPVFKDKKGDRNGFVWARYPQSGWRNLDLHSHCLAPTAQGPVATARFEYFREGVQHCEARIFLESALLDAAMREKVGDELARRCQAALDERQQAMALSMSPLQMDDPKNTWPTDWRGGAGLPGHIWFVGSGWQERSEKLYALAAEAAKRLGK